MASTPSQIASTWARSESSACLNFSSAPRSAGAFTSLNSKSGYIGGSNLRRLVPIPPDAPVINMRGISSLILAPPICGHLATVIANQNPTVPILTFVRSSGEILRTTETQQQREQQCPRHHPIPPAGGQPPIIPIRQSTRSIRVLKNTG